MTATNVMLSGTLRSRYKGKIGAATRLMHALPKAK